MQASLGETEQQLVSHYGTELIKTHDEAKGGAVALDRLSFNKDGFQYDVLLFKGVSSEESVYHRPYSPLTDAEVESLLDANKEGLAWAEIAPEQETLHWLHSVRSWRQPDGTIASLEEPRDKQPRLLFHVKSGALVAAQDAAQKASP